MKKASVYKAIFSNIIGCFFFMAIFAGTAQAQTRGTVDVVKDPRIDTLAARRATIKVTGSTGVVMTSTSGYGYRVQIYNGPARKDAYDAQSRFTNEHQGTRTYISYAEPDYKVRVGDFRTRIEAEKLVQELKGKFTGLFIIPGKINPPKINTGND